MSKLSDLDTSKTKKYNNWLYKNCINIDFDVVKNTFEDYLIHIQSKRVNTDIYHYKSFDALKSDVDIANIDRKYSRKGQQKDYDVVIDNNNVVLYHIRTHEAAIKIGHRYFSFRYQNGIRDCAWCTSFSGKSHFNYYYFNKDVSIYYLLIKKQYKFKGIAFLVYPNGEISATDELDQVISTDDTKTIIDYFNIHSFITHKASDKRYNQYLKIKHRLDRNEYYRSFHQVYLDDIYVDGDILYYSSNVFKALRRKLNLDGFSAKCYLYGYGIDVFKCKVNKLILKN